MEAAVHSPISDAHRNDLQQRLVDNFHALLFHREGYRPCNVPAELIEQMAAVVEAKAFLHVMRAAELGLSGAMVQAYAKEAATLLLAEVERYTIPIEAGAPGAAGPLLTSGSSVDMTQLSLNEFSGGLRSIQTAPSQAARPSQPRDAAWGWLVPGSRMLPYVVLKGAGVAIGRGKEALWAIGGGAGTPRSCLAGGGNGGDRHLTEVMKRNLGFVEVADGRVSRLHCIISTGGGGNGGGGAQAMLEDCSSNGTFLNHRKLAKGESVPLEDGDRISLVLSVAPLVEQYFTYRGGDPRDPEAAGSEEHSWVGSTSHSTAGVFSPGAVNSGSPSGGPGRPGCSAIFRTATSRYTTAEQSTLEDLRCQICLASLRQCVALEPCGHNFCATCLSHHLGNQLQSGLQLSCPFRCPPPERIIINYAVRALIDLLSSSGRTLSGPMASRAGSMGAAALAAAAGSSGVGPQRSSRGPPLLLQGAFGQAPGSSNSLAGLGGTPLAVAGGAGQQQPQQPQQPQHPQHGSSAEQASPRQQQQQQQQQAGSPPPAGAAHGSGGGGCIVRAASGSSPDAAAAGAAAAGGGGGGGGPGGGGGQQGGPAGGSSGLAGVAEEPAGGGGGSSSGGNRISRFAAAAGVAAAVAGSSPPQGAANGLADASRAGSGEADFYTQSMNVLCPLDDECLPMEASNLKTRQVEVALNQLKDTSLPHDDHLVCLEALARLAWSDDSVRQLIANAGGVRALVGVMALHEDSDSIQCNGCLALMSLVRGEGEVCQSNQWHVAKAGAIEVISAAMKRFRDSAMVQLSVLLCLIPVTLENAMMQAHVTQECLADIIAALDTHINEVDIQTKGLVLLGVLVQGEDAVHDAVRIRQLEAGVPRRVGAGLRRHGRHDDVLWAALFTLAVLVRDDSVVMGRAARALVGAGVFRVLEQALADYKQRHTDENIDPDEMIISAGDYLLRVLEPVQQQQQLRRALWVAAGGVSLGIGAALLLRHIWSVRGDSSAGSGSGSGAGGGGGNASRPHGSAPGVATSTAAAAAAAVVVGAGSHAARQASSKP